MFIARCLLASYKCRACLEKHYRDVAAGGMCAQVHIEEEGLNQAIIRITNSRDVGPMRAPASILVQKLLSLVRCNGTTCPSDATEPPAHLMQRNHLPI